MRKFKFSVVMSIYNSDLWLNKALNSLVHQTMDFEDNIQVVLVNDGSNDQSEEICLKFRARFPLNVRYIHKKENEGPAIARNVGLKYATGKYISFIDSDDYVSKNTFQKVYKFFESNYDKIDVVSIPIFFVNGKTGPHLLNYKYKKTQVVNLFENPDFIQLSASSSFFKSEMIHGLEFDSRLITSEDVTFLNQLLIRNPYLGICSEGKYFYRKRYTRNSVIDTSHLEKDYFINRTMYYFKFLIDESLKILGYVPLFIQYTLMYDIQWMILAPQVEKILSNDELKILKSNLHKILQYIDDDIIYNQKNIANYLKANTFFLKYMLLDKNSSKFKSLSTSIIKNLKLNTVFIDIFEIKNNNLYILGCYFSDFFFNEKVDLLLNGEKIETTPVDFPQRNKHSVGNKFAINHSFEVNIPLSKDKKSEIIFKSSVNNTHIDFERPCNFSKVGRYSKTKNFISTLKDDKIIIKNKNNRRWLKEEFKTIIKMLKNHEKGFKTGVPIRLLYMIFYPFMKNRKIWFFMDLPTIADDNGKHLFKYAVNQKDDAEKYFILDRSSKDFKEMSKIGDVIPYKSIKHRFLGLFCEKIITSHPDNNIIYPFWGNYPYFAGLLKSKTIFLQHGMTKDNVSNWLNKYDKNLSMLVSASKKEYDSLFEYPYNYKKDIVKLAGFPRFDNLNNEKDKLQIIIMPSWRNFLKNKSNETILKSDFFKKFNSLINNEKLINASKETGYEIIFKPHPNVYDFIELFETNDYVKIDYKNVKYQSLFNNASLLITDYSSVAFDFAYLKKPVLYYQYGDDYHFDINESYFNYKTMGFGEVCNDESNLVNLIINYMNTNCKLKKKYENNIENYFTFTDRNNCKRVYDEIKKLDKN